MTKITCYDGKLNVLRWQTLHAVFGNSTWRVLQNTRHSSPNGLNILYINKKWWWRVPDDSSPTHHPQSLLIIKDLSAYGDEW